MSDRLLRAINAAAWAHDGQLRKGTEIPYISHVFAVMHLVSQQSGVDEDTQIAALFHDVLEDVSERYSAVTMEEEFGEDVVEKRCDLGIFIHTGLLANQVHYCKHMGDVRYLSSFTQLSVMRPGSGIDGTEKSIAHNN